MVHDRFDVEQWIPRFPLTPSYGEYSGHLITSPASLCNNELLRRELQDQFDWGPAVPVDIFIMADGEPADRSVTKIGGLPCRRKDAPWPHSPDGRPMAFLAQFNFADSRDIVGSLPGDLLLIFVECPDGNFVNKGSSFIDSVHFEWRSLDGALEDLVDALPATEGIIKPCYGHIARVTSYPEATREPFSRADPVCRGCYVSSDFAIPQYFGTQIGSAPYLLTDLYDTPGRPLCTVAAVCVDTHGPYPWVNRFEPLLPPEARGFELGYFTLGDTGALYVLIDDDQNLHWRLGTF